MNTLFKWLIWPIMLAPAVYLALTWQRIPETVAMHFDIHGKPDRFGSKNELIMLAIFLIVVNVAVYLLVSNIYRIDPKKYAADNKERLKRIAFATAFFLSGILSFIIYNSTQDPNGLTFNTSFVLAAVGLLFAFIGNYMPNLKPNYFAGLRLPWTLENEDNWRKTHHLAGKLWFGGGLLLAVVCLFLPPEAALITFFTVMLLITIIPCVYSYKLYRRAKTTR